LISDYKIVFYEENQLFLLILTVFSCVSAYSQMRIFVGPSFGYGYSMRQRPYQSRKNGNTYNNQLPKFEPYVSISIGYGFPNLDKNQLPGFFNYYSGNVSQTGPVTGSVDYRFSRNMSIGLLVSHGNVSMPYYNYSSGNFAFTGALDNWSIMLNMQHYMQVGTDKASPYIRTAIGVNIWNQNFTDNSGNKLNMAGTPQDLAYQISLGTDIKLTKQSALFIEAGYGKYILQGGLKFKL